MGKGYQVLGSNNGLTLYGELDADKVVMLFDTEISDGYTWLSKEHGVTLLSELRSLIGYQESPVKKHVLAPRIPFLLSLDEDDDSLEIKLKRKSRTQVQLNVEDTIDVIKRLESLGY